ncbi:MAG: RING finger protein [Candidatus Hodarchaeota archaeon]
MNFLDVQEKYLNSENGSILADLISFLVENKHVGLETIKLQKKEKKELRKKVNTLLINEIIPYLKENWIMNDNQVLAELYADVKLSAILPKLLKKSLEQEEKKLMALSIKEDLKAGKQKLSEIRDVYSQALKDIGDFIGVLGSILPEEYNSSMNPLLESMSYQEQDLTRFFTKMEFFFQETQTQEEKVKIRGEIRVILDEIDELISDYEKAIGEKLKQKFLELEQILVILNDFKVKYNDITVKLNSTIRKYDAFKLTNIINDIKTFMEKRNATIKLINNMILVDMKENFLKVSRLMKGIQGIIQNNTNISIEMGEVIDSEFNAKLEDIEKILEIDTGDNGLGNELLIKKELSMIEERLSELSAIKNTLEDKRDRFLFKLLDEEEKGKFLEEKKIGECIICFNPVSALEDEGDVIQCPHCFRIGHYLCLAFWLQKYNICPVCHGKLVSPENYDTFTDDAFLQ